MAVLVLPKTKSGQAQIIMTKIFTMMSKTRPFYFYFHQKKFFFSVVSILCKITLSLLDIVIFPRRYFPHFTSTIKWYLSWSWQETILKIQIVVYQISLKNWKVLVENRLSEILENIEVDCWHYVPTECNPADIAARCNRKVKFNETLV